MSSKKARNRYCAKCNKVYFRCNKIAVWDVQNPGHRGGWHKEEAKYCVTCQPAKQVQRVLVVAALATLAPARSGNVVEIESARKKSA